MQDSKTFQHKKSPVMFDGAFSIENVKTAMLKCVQPNYEVYDYNLDDVIS